MNPHESPEDVLTCAVKGCGVRFNASQTSPGQHTLCPDHELSERHLWEIGLLEAEALYTDPNQTRLEV